MSTQRITNLAEQNERTKNKIQYTNEHIQELSASSSYKMHSADIFLHLEKLGAQHK